MSGPAIGRGVQDTGIVGRDAHSLVREAHHRVSNHLQILASVIGLQARAHPSESARDALLDVRRRILAVARVNSDLQQDAAGQVVNLPRFFGRMADDLRLSFSDEGALDLHLDFQIEDGVASAETAVTLGLIVNELVTNALKYAVLPVGGGVAVRLRRTAEEEWRLTVRDDGPGMTAEAFEAQRDRGLALVLLLVRQLKGRMFLEPAAGGAAISVCFH